MKTLTVLKNAHTQDFFKLTFALIFWLSIGHSGLMAQGETCGTAVEVFGGTYTANGPSSGNGAVNGCGIGTSTHADWYYFEAPANGTISISSCGDFADTRVSVFTTIACGLFGYACVANDDDGCPSDAGSTLASDLQDVTVTSGTRYYIQWDNFWSESGFEWTFDFVSSAGPGNDSPCNATTLACGETFTETTVNATPSGVDASCSGGTDNDVFYSLEATGGLEYTITVNGGDYDGVLAAYTGTCLDLTEIACADNGFSVGIEETITFTVATSQTVIIQTYDWSGTSIFTIEASCTEPDNDNCDNPIFIAVQTPGDCAGNETIGTTEGANSDELTNACEGDNPDVFYEFFSGTFSTVAVNINTISATDMVMNVLEGGCDATSLNCTYGSGSVTIETTPFTFYTIRVSSNTAFANVGTFSLCVEGIYDCSIFNGNIGEPCDDGNANTGGDVIEPGCSCVGFPIPGNDICANAALLSVNAPGDCAGNEITGTTQGASSDELSQVCEIDNADVFYSFNSGPYSSVVVHYAELTATDLLINVLEENCDGASLVCSLSEISTVATEPSTDYLIRISTNTNYGSTGTFTICVEGVFDCPLLGGNIGDACNDGNVNTGSDQIMEGCICAGFSPPDNELPCNADVITCATTNVSGTTVGSSLQEPCGGLEPMGSAWYVFTAPYNGTLRLNTCQEGTSTTDFETDISVYTGTCSDLTCYVYNDGSSTCAWLADANFEIEDGVTYYIQVHSHFASDFGIFDMDITCTETFECPALSANIGDVCNDGNPNTSGDTVTSDCDCVGTAISGSLSGTVVWNSDCGNRNVTISLYTPGTANLVQSFSTNVNGSGAFSVSGLPSGAFAVVVKVDGYLSKGYANVVIAAGGTNLSVGVLKNGDIDNNNSINGVDFALLAGAYLTISGDVTYNEDADLDCNGVINGIDFALLSANYLISGQVPPLLD